MLKLFFSLLLFANAALLAFQQGYLDPLLPSGHEPARMARQLNADKIKLVPLTDSAPAAQPAVEPAADTAPARADKLSSTLACTEIGNFDIAEARRFEARLASLSLGDRMTRRTIPESVRHMVFIPPQGSKEAADKKAEELRRLGVSDFFVIHDGSDLQWGISLGIFRTEEAARTQMATLALKGVRSARVGEHGLSNKFAFQLRRLDASAKRAVDNVKTDFPQQAWRGCE